jgi:hypothetical protein
MANKKKIKTVAREARDVPTAVGNIIKARNVSEARQVLKDIKKQFKETGRAVTTGKSGTKASMGFGESFKKDRPLIKGSQRGSTIRSRGMVSDSSGPRRSYK